MELTEREIIYDWNSVEKVAPLTTKPIEFFDESLRDGIQSPSVVDPRIEDKIRLLHLMSDLGIHAADLGLPGAGPRAFDDVLVLTKEVVRAKLRTQPGAAARTVLRDIEPIAEISQRAGIAVEVLCFIGSSPIRQYAESWDLDFILKRSAEAIDFCVKHGLPCTYVTEDTIRSRPDTLDRLFRNAISHGATRLCLCDTVGHATPDGIRNLIRFTRNLIAGTGADVKIDWHGHNDRGMGVTLSLHAIEFGADRVHGTALGIGERVGHSALDQILMNLKLLGMLEHQDLSKLVAYCKAASKATHWPIPWNYPLSGRDAFRTATGVHAAAIIKAEKKGDTWLADRIYSGVPAGLFGRKQEIEIGHMSGESNVHYWLRQRGAVEDRALVGAILAAAKASNHTLEEDEVWHVIREFQANPQKVMERVAAAAAAQGGTRSGEHP
jgi:2-isopropylmalate synthase